MKTKILSSILVIAPLAGCSQYTKPETTSNIAPLCSESAMPGGWRQSPITSEVEQAMLIVMPQVGAESRLKQINQVKTQVVNGVNYAIEFTLENGEIWNTLVFRNLRNDYMIEQVAKPGALCP